MRKGAVALFILAAAASVMLMTHVRQADAPPVTRTAPLAANPVAERTSELKSGLDRLMGVVEGQESGKDATCWTTVRMMDQHFAGKPMSDEIAMLKIEACKTLVYQVWRAASEHADQGIIHAAAIDAVVPEDVRKAVALMTAAEPVFSGDPVQSVMSRDYHRVTENKRYLYAIIADAITGTGLFEGRDPDISPLSVGGMNHLAAVATQITTAFLTASGDLAKSRGHLRIEAGDVRDAFAEAAPRYSRSPDQASSKLSEGAGTALPAVAVGSRAVDPDLLALTRRTIAGKIAALRVWNGKVWKDAADADARQLELVNRMMTVPFDHDSFRELEQRLERYARFLAYGVQPMRRNAFSASINGLTPDLTGVPANSYATLAWTRNVLDELFPRTIGPNGDVTVDIMGLPSQQVPDKRRSTVLLDWELDALRDTTLHWTLMKKAWDAPNAVPADPFALEMIADRLSELAFFFMKECDAVAQNQGKRVVGTDICEKILNGSQFVVNAAPPAGWTAADMQAKASVAAAYPLPLFRNASASAGFPARAGAVRVAITKDGPGRLVDFMGSGVAVGDADGDGLPDLFLPGDGGNRLLRNLGGRHFEDRTEALGITDSDCADAHHALFVDYDNDGRLDLFIVHSEKPSRLFHQEADGRFSDVTATCGIVTDANAHDAVFLDYDGDGLLDCYVGHYGGSKPTLDGRNGVKNRLFHNQGGGVFADVTDRAGVGSTGWTLATAAIDANRDGRMDLFVANDYGRSELFLNRGDGTFEECGHRYGVDDRGSSMNASVVDVDGDGWMDIYITQIDMFSKSIGFVFPRADSQININERILKSTFYIAGNKLFRNDHGARFTPVDDEMFEPGDRGWSWSGNFLDYDDDGDDDMWLSNGWVDQTPAADQAKQMFIRHGAKFFHVDEAGDESYRGNSRGAVAADLTGTGRVDLVVSNFDAPPTLLANSCANANRWIKVRLHGVRSNRYGIGAVITVTRADGGSQSKQVSCGSNYLSQDETAPLFGLGADGEVTAVTVVWPGNRAQRVEGPFKPGAVLQVTEPDVATPPVSDPSK